MSLCWFANSCPLALIAHINAFGRFDELKNSIDREAARKYFEKIEKKPVPAHKVPIKIDNIFGFDIDSIAVCATGPQDTFILDYQYAV